MMGTLGSIARRARAAALGLGAGALLGCGDTGTTSNPTPGPSVGGMAGGASGAQSESSSGGNAGSSVGGATLASAASGGEGLSAGGANGDGSSSGAAGQAGAPVDPNPCGFAAPFSCDDGNPCTVDTLDAECECRHEARAEGDACDDGDVCTKGDRCQAAECVGQHTASTPEVVGHLQSFGAQPGLQTLVALPAHDRALFATSGELVLLDLAKDSLRVLDDHALAAPIQSDFVGGTISLLQPRTFLVPLSTERVAVVARNWGIDLFDLVGDSIVPSERLAFVNSDLRAAAGAGSRLFTCVVGTINSYSIDAATSEITTGPTLNLPAGHTCHALALTPDGATLWAASSGGLHRVDVAEGGLAHGASFLAGSYLLDVTASGSFVAVFEAQESFGGAADVVALRADDMSRVARFAYEGGEAGEAGRRPMGFSLMGDNRLLVQWLEQNRGCSLHRAEFYALSADGASVLAEHTTLRACDSPYTRATYNTVASSTHAVIEPTRQVVRVDTNTGDFTPLRGAQQGSFARVRAAGSESIQAYGPTSLHLVSIKNPEAPEVLEGGLNYPMTLEWLRLVFADGGDPFFATVPEWGTGAYGERITLLESSDGELAAVTGSLGNVSSEGEWVSAGPALFHVLPDGEAEFRVRRYTATSFSNDSSDDADGQVPNLDQLLEVPVSDTGAEPVRFMFTADPVSGDLGLLDTRTTTGTNSITQFTWFELKDTGFQHAFSAEPVPLPFRGALMRDGQAVVVYRDQVTKLDASGSELGALDLRDIQFSASALLDYTPKYLYIAGLFVEEPRTEGVLVLLAEDLTEVARYHTPEPVLSSAEVGNHVAFGSLSSLSVAVPWCPEE